MARFFLFIITVVINNASFAQSDDTILTDSQYKSVTSFFQNKLDYNALADYPCKNKTNSIFLIEFEVDKNGNIKNAKAESGVLKHLGPVFLKTLALTNGKWTTDFIKSAKRKTIILPVFYSYSDCRIDIDKNRKLNTMDSTKKVEIKVSCYEVMKSYGADFVGIQESLKTLFDAKGRKRNLNKSIVLPFLFIEKNPAEKLFIM